MSCRMSAVLRRPAFARVGLRCFIANGAFGGSRCVSESLTSIHRRNRMRTAKPAFSLFFLLVAILATSVSVWAQSTATGTVVGTITDQSGAVVPGAQVTINDPSTGTTRTATTNSAGNYLFVDVNPGHYDLTITKQGFASTKASAEV